MKQPNLPIPLPSNPATTLNLSKRYKPSEAEKMSWGLLAQLPPDERGNVVRLSKKMRDEILKKLRIREYQRRYMRERRAEVN